MIPITTVQISEESERLVLEVLRSGQLAQGRVVAEFERLVADICGVDEAVAVANGTDALVLALRALDVGPGDEVITSPFTFIATLNAILQVGATARFADIDLTTFNTSAQAMDPLIGDATRALLPVHLYGLAVDMRPIVDLADRHGLSIVEDAAQALGARSGDRPVGSFGLGCFSFYATKNVTSGEGGVVTTSDPAVAERLRVLRNQGMRARYEYVEQGGNHRLTDLQAAVAVPQLRNLAEIDRRRRRNAELLSAGLTDLEGLVVPEIPSDPCHVFHQYTVRLTEAAPVERDALVAALHGRGVGAGVYYPKPVHHYDLYRSHPRVVADPCPNAALAASTVLSLPVHPHLTGDQVDQIIHAVRAELSA